LGFNLGITAVGKSLTKSAIEAGKAAQGREPAAIEAWKLDTYQALQIGRKQ
jgi:hypothetical protein